VGCGTSGAALSGGTYLTNFCVEEAVGPIVLSNRQAIAITALETFLPQVEAGAKVKPKWTTGKQQLESFGTAHPVVRSYI
jgi:hypothetical protein